MPRVFKSDAGRRRFVEVYEARLRAWPLPYRELDVSTRFGMTHLIASGPADAPALLLLGSFMATATVWRPNVAALSEHYRTYAVDVLGEPNKSVPTRRISSRRGYSDWLCDVLDALALERAFIIGNSYGGFLAASQASLTPARVSGVVLISPAATIAPMWQFYVHIGLASCARLLGRDPSLSGFFDWIENGVPRASDDESGAELVKLAVTEGMPVNLVAPRVFTKAELGRIRVPVLLLIGDRELIYEPLSVLRRAEDRMPTVTTAIVPGANHLAAVTRPLDVNRQVLDFLAQCTSSRQAASGKSQGV